MRCFVNLICSTLVGRYHIPEEGYPCLWLSLPWIVSEWYRWTTLSPINTDQHYTISLPLSCTDDLLGKPKPHVSGTLWTSSTYQCDSYLLCPNAGWICTRMPQTRVSDAPRSLYPNLWISSKSSLLFPFDRGVYLNAKILQCN